MKTAQNIAFFIRQLRPAARRHGFVPSSPGRIFAQHTKPSRTATSTWNSFSSPYSTRTQIPDGPLPQETLPGASFVPDKHPAESPSPSSPIKSPINDTPDPKAFTASIQTQRPSYQIHFTCKPCGFRSAHEISKHGYHSGSILVTCPSCKNRHVISDHLKVSTSSPLLSCLIRFPRQYQAMALPENELKTEIYLLIDHNRYSPTSPLLLRT